MSKPVVSRIHRHFGIPSQGRLSGRRACTSRLWTPLNPVSTDGTGRNSKPKRPSAQGRSPRPTWHRSRSRVGPRGGWQTTDPVPRPWAREDQVFGGGDYPFGLSAPVLTSCGTGKGRSPAVTRTPAPVPTGPAEEGLGQRRPLLNTREPSPWGISHLLQYVTVVFVSCYNSTSVINYRFPCHSLLDSILFRPLTYVVSQITIVGNSFRRHSGGVSSPDLSVGRHVRTRTLVDVYAPRVAEAAVCEDLQVRTT